MRTNVLTKSRVPDFSELYKIDIGVPDLKSKRILHRSVNQRNNCVHNHRNFYCVIRKKNRISSLLKGVGERERNSKCAKK